MLTKRRGRYVTLILMGLLAASLVGAPAIVHGQTCVFQLGFRAIADAIPVAVGSCLKSEQFNPANGNAEQPTTGGLLVWRKLDNWTAFTDGHRTWINGPLGLQQRLNTQRFNWESDAATAASPAPPSAERPGAIRGTLSYPSSSIPALRIYAIATNEERFHVVSTAPDEASFLISNVQPGSYFLLAYRVGLYATGGWSRYAQCGGGTGCRDHTLIPVTVTPGQTVTGIQVTDWYFSFGIPPPDWREHWRATTSFCWVGSAPLSGCPIS